VSTDIHGGIEFRHPGVGTDYYDGEPWVVAMDLWPLYDETDYAAFGCLFGVRNYAGFRPLAPASMDLATTPDHFIGRLTWHTKSLPSLLHQQLVSDCWPPEALSAAGEPPADLHRATGRVEWTNGEVMCAYEPLTAGAVLGPATHWPHVFAVMKAMADRFGDDGVRLVVAFD
jgi:hypothetical protein